MRWIKTPWPFIILSLLGLIVLVFSIFDVIYDWKLILLSIVLYIVLFILILLVIYLRSKKEIPSITTVEEFEKRLKGGLYHFKCPTCSGIFAIKKSKSNNKKYIKMTCPDCGAIGHIPPNPAVIEEEIPEKKSIKASFECTLCGEGITVWAEGTELYKDVSVYSCPFCGEKKSLKRF
jgi:predicted RNA-binding Zn-ribbon protein involved in translation (DUF1610 family)